MVGDSPAVAVVVPAISNEYNLQDRLPVASLVNGLRITTTSPPLTYTAKFPHRSGLMSIVLPRII